MDASKAVVVVFLSPSPRMIRSEFFRSCRNGMFHEVRGRESYVRILETARLGIFIKHADTEVSSLPGSFMHFKGRERD